MTALTITGKVYQSDGSTAQQNAIVYVYDKDLDESHNGNDASFTTLVSGADGSYTVDLDDFTGTWAIGDEIWISAYYEDKAQSTTFKLTGSNETGKNLTLRNLEPSIAIMKFLRSRITDYNTNRDDSVQLFKPKYSKKELSKDDYPRVDIIDTEETSIPAGIYSTNKAEETTTTIKLTIHVWARYKDEQIFEISGVKYEGTKLRDHIAREICNALRKEFNTKPSYNIDAVLNKFYSYERIGMQSLEFDEEKSNGIMEKEIIIKMSNINQEV